MARGDFGKAYGVHRKSGGVLSRKDFAEQLWPKLKQQQQEVKEVKVEVEEDGEA